MAESIKSFERYCRLCAEEQDVTVMLFSTEAEDMLLMEKLRVYLQIEISETDKFPKSICINCCYKLESLCEFVELVRQAQRNLNILSISIEEFENAAMVAIKEEQTEFTEICVDPMDILNMSNDNSTEYKNTCADDLVTLKLIPKNEEMEENKPKKKFECDVCHKSFQVEQSLKNHSWTHIQEAEHSCFTCQRSFRFKEDLDKHMNIHKNTSSRYLYSCDLCGRRFKTEYTQATHMQIHKTMTKSYTCSVCNRSYSNWTGLRIHSITHSSEKPFQCDMCDKKFKRKQELKFHMNHHTGAKPYKCIYCNKCFASSGNLYSHRNRVHNYRDIALASTGQENENTNQTDNIREPSYRYQCHFCKKGCGRRENYVYHMFQHTGLKPYKCSHCTEKFITQRSLSLHYDNAHPYTSKPPIQMPVFCPIRSKWI